MDFLDDHDDAVVSLERGRFCAPCSRALRLNPELGGSVTATAGVGSLTSKRVALAKSGAILASLSPLASQRAGGRMGQRAEYRLDGRQAR